ncbi:MAG: hypothetical protein AMXMBFR55_27310 [Gemmatimonadota bacterium]
MKKIPLKVSRNGRMSDSACSPNSDSAMMSPARNAPSASDRPNDEVTKAAPRPMATTTSVKISWFRIAAMRARSRGTTQRPTTSIAVVTAMATATFRTIVPTDSPLPASRGRKSMSGTTHRSWKRRIATTTRPYVESSSPRSA